MSREVELTSTRPRVRVVAGILIDGNDSILIADRARSGTMTEYWEFPGGKVTAGESQEAALARELDEELGIRVTEASHFAHNEHDYDELDVAIDFYLVRNWQGKPRGLEGQSIQWVTRSGLHQQKLLPADAPIIEALQSLEA